MSHILLVDDDRDGLLALRNRLRFAFQSHLLTVDVADSAVTGLILAHEYPYDAILVDLLMPGTTGIKFAEQLRCTQPRIPIIMMSDFDVNIYQDQVADLRLTACVPKPIEFGILVGLLADILNVEHQGSSRQQEGIRLREGLRSDDLQRATPGWDRNWRSLYGKLNVDDLRLHTS